MHVSVVIPHLRGRETLLPLLEDLKREAELVTSGVEVVLVDNASTDGSVEAAKKAHPWIKVERLERNEGYAGGCNWGIKASQGEWIWLLNDDVRLEEGVINEMLKVADRSETIAAIQPKILSLQKREMFDYAGGAGGMIDKFGFPFALGRVGGVMEKDLGQYNKSQKIFWASGTACLWRQKTLTEIGVLDESFFAHMEEIDLSWRAWNAGWEIWSSPAGSVYHLGGGTLAYQSWKKKYLNHRNSLFTLTKNHEAKTLSWLIPVRWIMDHGVGLAELLHGRPGRIAAVAISWWAYLIKMPTLIEQRNRLQIGRKKSDAELSEIVYQGSILYDYSKGVRKASEIVA
jgi:GT2 family glycosyltransferase